MNVPPQSDTLNQAFRVRRRAPTPDAIRELEVSSTATTYPVRNATCRRYTWHHSFHCLWASSAPKLPQPLQVGLEKFILSMSALRTAPIRSSAALTRSDSSSSHAMSKIWIPPNPTNDADLFRSYPFVHAYVWNKVNRFILGASESVLRCHVHQRLGWPLIPWTRPRFVFGFPLQYWTSSTTSNDALLSVGL